MAIGSYATSRGSRPARVTGFIARGIVDRRAPAGGTGSRLARAPANRPTASPPRSPDARVCARARGRAQRLAHALPSLAGDRRALGLPAGIFGIRPECALVRRKISRLLAAPR